MAAREFRADYVELSRLAGDVLTAADGIGDALGAGREVFTVPAAAFGNSSAGAGVHGTHEVASGRVGATSERLVEVLEGDVDRLYRVAFAYKKLDEDNADRICRRSRGMGGVSPC